MIQPLERPMPTEADGLRLHLHGHVPDGATPILVYEDLLLEVLRHVRPFPHAGGLLTGGYYLGEQGPYVDVRGFTAAGPVGSNTGLVRRVREASVPPPGPEGPGAVGWFHSRRAPAPDPTPEDLRIHAQLFPHPWQVMLLLEIDSERVTVFQQGPRGPLLTGFWRVTPVERGLG